MSDEAGLFLQGVIDAKGKRLHGNVVLQQTASLQLAVLSLLVVVVLCIGLLLVGRYARAETARGILVPVDGSSKIYAIRPGIVTSLTVKEGDYVKAGQRLAVISVETPNGSGELGTKQELGSNVEQARLTSRQIGLSAQRSASEAKRLAGVIAGLQEQVGAVSQQIALQREYVASAVSNFEQLRTIVDKGYVSKFEYERRHQAMLAAQQDLSRLQQQAEGLHADVARTKMERVKAELEGQNDKATAQVSLEALHQQRTKIAGEASYSLTAPVAGHVTSLQVNSGSTVTGLLPLMAILPYNTRLRADIFVPGRAIGFIKPKQEVRLLYDAFPYQRYGSAVAHVETISHLAIAGAETGAPFKIDEPVYRVTAKLDGQAINAYGQPAPLQPGMTLIANIVLERQSFTDWILDPFRAVARRN